MKAAWRSTIAPSQKVDRLRIHRRQLVDTRDLILSELMGANLDLYQFAEIQRRVSYIETLEHDCDLLCTCLESVPQVQSVAHRPREARHG